MVRPIYDLLTKGQTVLINGRCGSYQVMKALKTTVFQALTVETNTPMDKCMVFEWMDADLWSLRARAQELGQPFLKATARSILEAVKVFSDMDGQDPVVHTELKDINPNNVLVSNVDSPKPSVKLSDLGAVIPSEGFDEWRLQSLATRAPELWKGVLPAPPCDVWSVGVTLAHFLAARALFGPGDQNAHANSLPKEINQAAWAIGKIVQLVGPLERNENPKYKLEFDLAELFVKRGIIKMGSLEEELARVNAAADCISFIRYLLTLDHKKRPTAEQALQHGWLQSSV
ncbi:hypothetical protein PRK78_004878 [Emydomyces testavorans]|uniref:Protein kinase domain-containing protein n=1 Tax=Emydomyces testavorans TaxID=2070801 RepID=A0AAF0DL04_9EURO|nr:hypothetical protein PRK78_004878 [Emydomyces testavorans]